jgi:hypothetical protein
MTQIYLDMGWDIPLEDIAPAQPDEGQLDVLNMEQPVILAPIEHWEEISASPLESVLNNTKDK